jgi:peptide/nickel transport system substrate-binding protein
VDFINPMLSSSELSNYIENDMFEAVVGNNPRTQAFIPSLCHLPEESADHLTLTFTMDSTAHWSDGKPVTAEDVVFSYKIINNPFVINVAPLRSYFNILDSCWIPAGHPDQVVFHFNKYRFDLLKITSYARIVPKHIWDPTNLTDKFSWAELKQANPKNPAIKQLADQFQDPKVQRDPKYMIASGPYKYETWVTNDHVTLVRDTNYWARNHAWLDSYPDRITFKTIKDQNAALIALKHGDIDIDPTVTASQYLNDLDSSKFPNIRKDTVYENLVTFIGWNNQRPLFADKNVRKALTMLINRDEILQAISHGLNKEVDGPVAPTQPNYDATVKQPAYNVEGAKALLAQEGWKAGSDGILQKMINGKMTPFRFSIMLQTGNDVGKQTLLIISNDLKKAGIDAEITQLELSVFSENLRGHNFDAYSGGWVGNQTGSEGTEDEIAQLWESSQIKNGGSNYYGYSDPTADSLMEAIKVEPDRAKRFELSHRLQHIITDDQPVTFLFSTPDRIAWINRFDNFELFPTRPPFDPRYWIVKGSGAQRIPTDAVMSMNPSERTEPAMPAAK